LARRRPPIARSSNRPPSSFSLARGFSALELLFIVALLGTVCGIAVPPVLNAVDHVRAVGAARYVSTRLQRARMEAVTRSANVGVRFSNTASGYELAAYVDGNGNGVSARDILRGVDWLLGSIERLPDTFTGVEFGTLPGLPPVDAGGAPPGADPIHLGASNMATFTAGGTSSTGSVYIRGHGQRQFVVRIYGDTGKTRVLEFDHVTRRWKLL
jgi:type II secretory pathway pseudopilin PulG